MPGNNRAFFWVKNYAQNYKGPPLNFGGLG